MRTPHGLAPQMIGRQRELRELQEHLAEALSGCGRLVFLAGPAGIGKTCLTRALATHVQTFRKSDLVAGYCYEEDVNLPYAPFVDAFRAFAREHGREAIVAAAGSWIAELGSLLPDFGAPPQPSAVASDAQRQKRRLFEGICRVLRPRPEHTCRLVVLEDLHWSDQTSLELLHYLARNIAHDPVLILATYRSDELHARHPLVHLIAQLTRERFYHEIRLDPLSREDLSRMLETTLRRPLPYRFVDVLYDRTEGNPFFVEELLKSMIEHNRLDTLIDQAQQGQRIARLDIPLSVKETVLRRTADLDPTTAAVLGYAAVIGRRFDFELLLRLTGSEERALVRAIALLIERHLVVEERSGPVDTYSFRHALTREAVYGDLLGRERTIKHREVLHALEEMFQANPEQVVDQLTHHSREARQPEAAARYAELAGDRALRMYANREAVAHYEGALDLLQMQDSLKRAELYYKLGFAAWPLGNHDVTAHYWREALRLYEQLGERHSIGDIYLWLSHIAAAQGNAALSLAHVRAAAELLEAEPPSRELSLAYSTLAIRVADLHEAISWGEKALSLADELQDAIAQPAALRHLGMAFVELGMTQRGVAYLERALQLSRQAGISYNAFWDYLHLADSLTVVGEFQRAADVFREAIRFAEEFGHEELSRGILLGNLAVVEMELGQWTAAHDLLDQAIRAGEMGYLGARRSGTAVKGELLLREGQHQAALQLLERILQDNESIRMYGHGRWCWPAVVRACLLGDGAAAAAALDEQAARWQDQEPRLSSQQELSAGIAAYVRAGCVAQATALLDRLSVLALRSATPLALALLADSRGRFAQHDGRYRPAAAHFRQAGERWHAMGLPFQEACSRRGQAENLLQGGDPADREQAGAELAAAQRIFERLGAPVEARAVDALVHAHGLAPRRVKRARRATSVLTPREHEVITLLVQQYSNREIAQALVISERTVEIHVSNILGKLGCTSRASAAAYAVEHGLVGTPIA